MISNSRVIFLNKPKDLIETHRTERRNQMLSFIEDYLNDSPVFGDKTISVTFFDTGVTGLTCLVETPDKKFVLKVHLYPDVPAGEDIFIKAWETAGISVPHIYEIGLLDECPYMLMSYVEAQTLEEVPESTLIERNVFGEMGTTLAKMHTIKSVGFGSVSNGNTGGYKDFKSWVIENQKIQTPLKYATQHNLLPIETFGSVEDAITTLTQHIGDTSESVYCHWDFVPGNIFDTNPLTVFDPVPTFNHPYLDIARSIMQTIAQGFINNESHQQFLHGYFSGKSFDKKLLYASLLFVITKCLTGTEQTKKWSLKTYETI